MSTTKRKGWTKVCDGRWRFWDGTLIVFMPGLVPCWTVIWPRRIREGIGHMGRLSTMQAVEEGRPRHPRFRPISSGSAFDTPITEEQAAQVIADHRMWLTGGPEVHAAAREFIETSERVMFAGLRT